MHPTFLQNFGNIEAHPSPRVRRNLGVGCKAPAGAATMGAVSAEDLS